MSSEGRDHPLCRITICSRFIHTMRPQRTCEVDGRSVGIEWCLDFNQAIENSGTIIIVGYGSREAVISAAGGIKKTRMADAALRASGETAWLT
jgi:hypothetical protein